MMKKYLFYLLFIFALGGNLEVLANYENLKITGDYNCTTKIPSVRFDLNYVNDDGVNEIVYSDTYNKTNITTVGCGGHWLSGYKSTSNTCKLLDVTFDENDYFVNYECVINEWWVPGATSGGNSWSKNTTWTGSFQIYTELCPYNSSFCKSFSYSDVIKNNSNSNTCDNVPSGELIDKSIVFEKIDENNKNNLVYPIYDETTTGDPVKLSTGEFEYDNNIMQYASKGFPFEFSINYKNRAYYNGPLGNNFDYNYNKFLVLDSDGNINYHNGKLGVFKFVKNANGFEYNDVLKASLISENGKYKITLNNEKVLSFGENLKLEKIEDNFQNTMIFEYDSNNQLTKIIDTNSRVYNISHYENSRIKDITDFTGNKVEFIYFTENETTGSQFDLKTIKMLNGNSEKEISFTYTIGADFESSHNIVKLIDSANNTYVENTYDSFDRVLSQKYGNENIYYNYTTDINNKITKNSVTDREGNVIDYFYDNFGNTIKKVIKRTSGDLEYNYSYDSNNNLIKEINPLGNGFTYSYDIKNNLIEKRQKADTSLENSTNDIVVSFEYDDIFNKKTKEILPNGTSINYILDDFGNVIQKETIAGNIQINESFEYNELGQLVSKIDGNGNIVNFEYVNGNLSKIIKKGPHLNPTTLQLQDSCASTPSFTCLPEGEEIATEFIYDSKGNITKITDGEGHETNLSYDDFNLLNSQTTPNGIQTNFEYNSLNKKTKETIILNSETDKITSFEYDILDNPTLVTTNINSIKNKTIVTRYDNNNRITETQNGSNAKNTFLYDENGNITKKSTILNDNTQIITSYIYDLNNRLIKQINPNNSEINFEYDLFDRLIKATNSDNSYTTNTYDNIGNLLETRSYDLNDNLVSKTSFEYDKLSRKTKQINHLLEENKQIITSYSYDNNSNILSQTNALNQTTSFVYDSFNRLIKTTDNLGNIIEYKYNKNDKVTEEKLTGLNGSINIKNYEYDNDNRLVKELNQVGVSSTNTKQYIYNNLNQIIEVIDENGNITSYTYDLLGNKTSEKKGFKIINYEYDENSNMIKLIDANGNETNYEFDELNRLVKQTYPDNSYTNYTYDINSNVSKKIDGNGTIINYTYDSQNRLIEKNITNGENVIGVTKENYFYDSLGRLIKTNNNEGTQTLFNYDSLNRLTSETQNGKIVNYTYDSLGNRTSINLDGKTTIYNYDSNSRLETISRENYELVRYNYDSLNLLSQTYGNGQTTTYGYEQYGNRLQSLTTVNKNFTYEYTSNNLIQSNGYEDYTYDENNQLTQVNFNTRFVNKDSIEYSFDPMGNRLNETYGRINKKGNINNFKDFTYTTNNLNQYTNKEIYTEEENQENENLEDIILIPETSSGTTSEEDEFTESEPLVELDGKLIYDKNGNMIGNMLNNKRQYIYSYDYKNRLVKVEKTIYKKVEKTEINEVEEITKIIQYRYDNLDRRIQKIYNNGSYTNYYYSNKDIILEENYTKPNNNGISKLKTSKYFINGNNIDDVLAMEKVDYKTRKVQEEYINEKGKTKTRKITENYTETNTYYYHKNHLNSIVAITDNSGNILEEYEYDVFGKPYSKDILTGKITNLKASTIGNTRLFTGREYERGLQLYYNRARYYSPDLGRFISRDPIDISDDVNLYAYVGNSVVNYSDVLGLAKSMTADEFRIAFVRAYDDYLSTKSRLESKLNAYYAGQRMAGNNPYKNVENQFLKLRAELKEKEDIARQMHYDRNIYNTSLPKSGNEAILRQWKIVVADYHQYLVPEGEENIKYVSQDGHKEVVFYYLDGKIDNTIENRGTYNFYAPEFNGNGILHMIYDVGPYKKWGNGLGDMNYKNY